jgi:hypothetical protein
MVKRLLQFFSLYILIWQDNKTLIITLDTAKAIYSKIEKLLLQQQIKVTGYAERKKNQKKAVVVIADIIASALYSYAYNINDEVLMKKVKYSRSQIFRLRDLKLETLAYNMITIATPILPDIADQGITQDTLDNCLKEVKIYNEIRSEPMLAIKKRKTISEEISKLLKELRSLIYGSLDKFMKQYEISHPEFYNEYKNQREIVDAPTHKLSLKGTVTNKETKEPLLDVIVTIPELKEKAETTEHGNYQFKNLKRGSYKIEFQREGYKTITLTTEILDNRTTELNVEIEKIIS